MRGRCIDFSLYSVALSSYRYSPNPLFIIFMYFYYFIFYFNFVDWRTSFWFTAGRGRWLSRIHKLCTGESSRTLSLRISEYNIDRWSPRRFATERNLERGSNWLADCTIVLAERGKREEGKGEGRKRELERWKELGGGWYPSCFRAPFAADSGSRGKIKRAYRLLLRLLILLYRHSTLPSPALSRLFSRADSCALPGVHAANQVPSVIFLCGSPTLSLSLSLGPGIYKQANSEDWANCDE